MIYVMSDLHGEYDKYLAMLEKIGFSEEDDLYIVGDVLDRGRHPVKILRDMAARPNVWPLLGNHELMAMDILPALMTEITEENCESCLNRDVMAALLEWQGDGGETTLEEFYRLSKEERMDVLDYLQEFEAYAVVDAGERTFLLVHAGLGNFTSDKPLKNYTLAELAFSRMDYDREYFTDETVYIITGHMPTLSLCGKAEIYHCGRNICIDCGAVFPKGRLACLCLDTMEEFYV